MMSSSTSSNSLIMMTNSSGDPSFASNDTAEDDDYYYQYDYDASESHVTFDWTELGPSLFVYGITFFAGILGNILILVAVIRNTQFMKSSPVNVFLGSLASADLLLISICLPLKVTDTCYNNVYA